MPYTRSGVRQSATQRLHDLKRSFIYAKIRTRSLPTYVRDAIFQNSVFQLSSTLEDYIWELTGQWFATLQSNGATNSKIPLLTRTLFTARLQEEFFKRYLGLGDENDLATKIQQNRQIFTLFEETSTFVQTDFNAKILKDKKFPSVNNIETLFRRLGIAKILNLMSKRTKSDVTLALKSFMDVRNALAHENPPSITDVDVDKYFKQIERWIDAIDREFFKHIVTSSGMEYWK
jgi:hypothetical protein